MSATIPAPAAAVGLLAVPAPDGSAGRARRWRSVATYLHPLTVICAVQATLALTLVWSNTAFSDEASYLWLGHLILAHWQHGTSWPAAYGDHILSGAPTIYPPLGALADSLGGLAGARVLSMIFMLGATVLLYRTASRLTGRTQAIAAAAIWAVSEPAIRLAFATYDPLSVLLTALSAWLAVESGYRRRLGWFVAGSAASLALANATAYSGIVIDPVVIGLVALVSAQRMRPRQALLVAGAFTVGLVACFLLIMTATGSLAGLAVVVDRGSRDHQSLLLVLGGIWRYSGFIIGLAVIGAVAAILTDRRRPALLVAFLACAAFVVPAAQLRLQMAWPLDKHLAYGIWFAAIAAGYGCVRLVGWLPAAGKRLAVLCAVLCLTYPAVNDWQAAWATEHEWADARSFIAAFRPAVQRSHGFIYAAGQVHIGEYYTPAGADWTRWNEGGLSLDPVTLRRAAWSSYYSSGLRTGRYGLIALFYATSFSQANLPGSMLLSARGGRTYTELLGLVGVNSGEPGLPALTLALERDPAYHLIAVGPYNSTDSPGVFAIWQRAATLPPGHRHSGASRRRRYGQHRAHARHGVRDRRGVVARYSRFSPFSGLVGIRTPRRWR